MQGWRCGRLAGMTADFPAHCGWQNDAHFKRLEPNSRQPMITAADARPIRRSRGYFDRRIDNLPEAQLRKPGARGKNAA